MLLSRKLPLLATCAALGLLLTGCAGPKYYLLDRYHDALDMVNIGAELDGVGASVQVGPLSTGLIAAGDKGYGLQFGEFGEYEFVDLQVLFLGMKYAEAGTRKLNQYQCMTLPNSLDIGSSSGSIDPYSLGTIEVRVALGLSLHLGIHLGEILDFILGWFGLDIMKDDRYLN